MDHFSGWLKLDQATFKPLKYTLFKYVLLFGLALNMGLIFLPFITNLVHVITFNKQNVEGDLPRAKLLYCTLCLAALLLITLFAFICVMREYFKNISLYVILSIFFLFVTYFILDEIHLYEKLLLTVSSFNLLLSALYIWLIKHYPPTTSRVEFTACEIEDVLYIRD